MIGRLRRRCRLAALGALLLHACADPVDAPGGAGEELAPPTHATRVLAASASAFDVIVDLLPRERIAAIPRPALEWSPLPGGREAWTDFPVLERFEGELALALEPDLVVASTWTERAPLAAVREASIYVLELPDAGTWDDLTAAVTRVGEVVGTTERAREVVDDLARRRAALADAATDSRALRVLAYSNFGAGGTTAGTETTVDLMIRLAGHVNAAAEAGLARHPQLSLEQVIAIDPDVFLTASGRDGVHPGAEFLRSEEALAGLRAIRDGRIVVLPADLYSTASHRVLDAAEELARLVVALGD